MMKGLRNHKNKKRRFHDDSLPVDADNRSLVVDHKYKKWFSLLKEGYLRKAGVGISPILVEILHASHCAEAGPNPLPRRNTPVC